MTRHTTAVGLSMVAGVLASLAVMSLTGPDSDAKPRPAAAAVAATNHEFTLRAPDGWKAVPAEQLAALPAHPLAVVRSADGRATVVVRRASPMRASSTDLAAMLGKQLDKRFAGFRPVSARLGSVRGGKAFVYTFVRAPHRTVQTLALVSTHGRAYAIDAVAPGGAPELARQAGAVVASFGP